MQSFKITLDSPSTVYYANTQASGTLCLRTTKPIKATKIELTIKGRAKTFIYYPGEKATARASVEFINNSAILWEPPNVGSKKFPAGNYEFPFNFFIPQECPPNIEHHYGNIRYIIEAKIVIPWSFNEITATQFTVCPWIDLNEESRLSMPVVSRALSERNMTVSRDINVTASIPKMGYVCGETIPLKLNIFNTTGDNIASIKTALEAVYTFHGAVNYFGRYGSIREKIDKVYFCKGKAVLPPQSNSQTIYTTDIEIPAIPPSFGQFDIINLKYQISIKISTTDLCSKSIQLYLPIIIGTVPIKSGDNSASLSETLDLYVPSPAPKTPPPGYSLEEAKFQKGPTKKWQNTYQPRFPYFSNFENSSFQDDEDKIMFQLQEYFS